MNTTQNIYRKTTPVKGLDDSPVAKTWFGSVRWAWLWLLLRLYLGWEWLQAGWWGLDRWILPALGTPWRPGYIFHEVDGKNSTPTVKQSSGVKP